MILLDASVIVDYMRRPTDRVSALLDSNRPFVAGVTRAELLHGARGARELETLEQSLAHFRQVLTQESTWTQLARNLYSLRVAGLAVTFQDVLLATLAIENGMEVWTLDAHFQMMRQVLTALKIFQPEAE